MIEMLCAKNLDHIIFRSYITELEIWASILEVDNHSQLYDSGHIQLLCVFNQKMRNDYNKEFIERILIIWDINTDVPYVWKC